MILIKDIILNLFLNVMLSNIDFDIILYKIHALIA